ncbi:hypothetical protein BZA77DRAFT_299030 [Pyronema omphalodes]|nr:hypothetical protein BZA77DRAFT_299030 [Pyronema omphalodes]
MHPTNNKDYMKHQRLVEFASLQQIAPPGVYLTLSPIQPFQIWHGVLFPRRGPYASAIIRFTFDFASGTGLPTIDLNTRVFHPLVDPICGRVHLPRRGPTISDLLEELKTIFESSDLLDSLAEGQIVDRDAWKSWNGRREGTAGWTEKVERLVDASKEAIRSNYGDKEPILLKGDIDDVDKTVVDKFKNAAAEGLRERGIHVREY